MHPEAMIPRRVVVTGMSVVSALGFDLDTFWNRLVQGDCGIRRLPFVPEDTPLKTHIGGIIDREAFAEILKSQEIKEHDLSNQMALYVAAESLRHAGMELFPESTRECDVIFGTGHGNILFHNESISAFFLEGWRKLRPTTIVRAMFNRPANIISIRHKLTGTSFTVSAACATGSIAFGNAFNNIRFGLADRALAACSDSGMDLPSFATWNRLGVMTKNNDPATASRPFDSARDGLVMGEGAAAFVLESLESAQARNAPILAEVIGYGASSDAGHIVQPSVEGQVKAIRKAMNNAGITPEEIDYVNAHGTATELADKAEAASLQEALGEHGRKVPVSNTKAQLGHLMGATAGVELVTTLLAMQKGEIPASRNLDHPDPACPLNFVRNQPLKMPVRVALKNSFAFGGSNSVVILRRFQDF